MTTCIPRKSPTLSSFVPLGPSAGSKLPASDPNTICCLLLHVSGDVDAYGIPQAGLRRPCPTYLVRSPQRGYGKPIISSRSPVHPINIFSTWRCTICTYDSTSSTEPPTSTTRPMFKLSEPTCLFDPPFLCRRWRNRLNVSHRCDFLISKHTLGCDASVDRCDL